MQNLFVGFFEFKSFPFERAELTVALHYEGNPEQPFKFEAYAWIFRTSFGLWLQVYKY